MATRGAYYCLNSIYYDDPKYVQNLDGLTLPPIMILPSVLSSQWSERLHAVGEGLGLLLSFTFARFAAFFFLATFCPPTRKIGYPASDRTRTIG